MPDKAGHLFWTAGHVGQGTLAYNGTVASGGFMHSINGGSSWSPIANVKEVTAFGFGGTEPGKSYPTIYIAGYVGSTCSTDVVSATCVYGIYKSTDEGTTWTQIGDYPYGIFDRVKALEGNKINTDVYVGIRGTGFALGTESAGTGRASAALLSGANVR